MDERRGSGESMGLNSCVAVARLNSPDARACRTLRPPAGPGRISSVDTGDDREGGAPATILAGANAAQEPRGCALGPRRCRKELPGSGTAERAGTTCLSDDH